MKTIHYTRQNTVDVDVSHGLVPHKAINVYPRWQGINPIPFISRAWVHARIRNTIFPFARSYCCIVHCICTCTISCTYLLESLEIAHLYVKASKLRARYPNCAIQMTLRLSLSFKHCAYLSPNIM